MQRILSHISFEFASCDSGKKAQKYFTTPIFPEFSEENAENALTVWSFPRPWPWWKSIGLRGARLTNSGPERRKSGKDEEKAKDSCRVHSRQRKN